MDSQQRPKAPAGGLEGTAVNLSLFVPWENVCPVDSSRVLMTGTKALDMSDVISAGSALSRKTEDGTLFIS